MEIRERVADVSIPAQTDHTLSAYGYNYRPNIDIGNEIRGKDGQNIDS